MKKTLLAFAILLCSASCSSFSQTTLTLKFFIEGYFEMYPGTGLMSPLLYNLGITGLSTDVDYTKIELHNAGSPYGLAATATPPCILQNDGILQCSFSGLVAGNYFIVIRHRNAVETWSSVTHFFPAIGSAGTYDFSTGIGKAGGNNQVIINPCGFPPCASAALYSGDVSDNIPYPSNMQDGSVCITDWDRINEDLFLFAFGYYSTDLNGDTFTDLNDYGIWEKNSVLGVGVKRPPF